MVQVSDKDFCEPIVVMVKFEARLEVSTKANGACLQVSVELLWLKKNKAYISKYTF